jgi:hypothetical protein
MNIINAKVLRNTKTTKALVTPTLTIDGMMGQAKLSNNRYMVIGRTPTGAYSDVHTAITWPLLAGVAFTTLIGARDGDIAIRALADGGSQSYILTGQGDTDYSVLSNWVEVICKNDGRYYTRSDINYALNFINGSNGAVPFLAGNADQYNYDSDFRYIPSTGLSIGELENYYIGNIPILPYPYTKIKDPTGFVDPDNVIVTYDGATRKVTLTGSVEAYYQGKLVPELVSGWISPAHNIPSGVQSFFLYYNGVSVVWSLTPWDFDMQMIALVYRDGVNICIRECHGLNLSYTAHKIAHDRIGTYLTSGGDFSSYVLNSTTVANRRPDISLSILYDEDLKTSLPSFTTKIYSRLSLSSADTVAISLDNAEIVNVLADRPYYNQYTGGAWQQTLMSNNAYQKIFILAIPVSSGVDCQKSRYVFIQGQTENSDISIINAITPASVNLSYLKASINEFCFIGEIVIRYTASNWQLISVAKIGGSMFSQTAIPVGNFLSIVTTDATLTGLGTVGSPLSASSRAALAGDNSFAGNQLITGRARIGATLPTDVAGRDLIVGTGGISSSGSIRTDTPATTYRSIGVFDDLGKSASILRNGSAFNLLNFGGVAAQGTMISSEVGEMVIGTAGASRLAFGTNNVIRQTIDGLGITTFSNSTDTTGVGTGSIQIAGGVYIAKTLRVGNNLYIATGYSIYGFAADLKMADASPLLSLSNATTVGDGLTIPFCTPIYNSGTANTAKRARLTWTRPATTDANKVGLSIWTDNAGTALEALKISYDGNVTISTGLYGLSVNPLNNWSILDNGGKLKITSTRSASSAVLDINGTDGEMVYTVGSSFFSVNPFINGFIIERGSGNSKFEYNTGILQYMSNATTTRWLIDEDGEYTASAFAGYGSRILQANSTGTIVPTDIDIEKGSFTFGLNGMSGTVAGLATYTKIGNLVAIHFAGVSGTSTSGTHSIIGLPVYLQSKASGLTSSVVVGKITDNGVANNMAVLTVSKSENITIERINSSLVHGATGWATSGTFGLPSGISITYRINDYSDPA